MANSTLSYYLAGAILTVISAVAVLIAYALLPSVRKHPSPIIIWRSILDIAFSFFLIVLYAYPDGKTNAFCTAFAFCFQFFLLGASLSDRTSISEFD